MVFFDYKDGGFKIDVKGYTPATEARQTKWPKIYVIFLTLFTEIERPTNETLAAQHPAGPTHPIIRTAPSRHAKRKTKSSSDQKDQEKIDAVVTNDARQREAAEPTEWSQSSATEALVSQGKMELLLVVR